jgi:hypothetical protein
LKRRDFFHLVQWFKNPRLRCSETHTNGGVASFSQETPHCSNLETTVNQNFPRMDERGDGNMGIWDAKKKKKEKGIV